MNNHATRTLIAAAISTVLFAAVAISILTVGIIPIPEFASLSAQPDPAISGRIAYVESRDSKSCVRVVEASGGTPKDISCFDGYVTLTWLRDGRLATVDSNSGGASVAIFDTISTSNPERFVASGLTLPSSYDSDQGFNVESYSDSRDEDAHIYEGAGYQDPRPKPFLSVRAPRGYSFNSLIRSPDRKWLLVSDSKNRLLIVDPRTKTIRQLTGATKGTSASSSHYADVWFQADSAALLKTAEELRSSGSANTGNVPSINIAPTTRGLA